MSGTILLALRILLTLALYAFIGWALILIWRDLRQQQNTISQQKVPAIELNIQLDEEDRLQRFNIPEIIIGRDHACECQLPGETVSAQHARLSHHHGQWWFDDLDSTNGSFLNENQVFTSTVVVSGDQIRCGAVTMSITIEE